MKNILSTSLKQFLTDFNLTSKDGIICFPANVNFTSSLVSLKLSIDIHIITIQPLKIDVMYLMYPDKEHQTLQLPDMFSISEDITEYSNNECLTIHGSSLIYGDYKLEIRPK